MLKLSGRFILNLRDLQKKCDPLEILNQKDDFAAFAEVHCVPLPIIFQINEKKYEQAEWLTKEFWNYLLKDESIFEEIKAGNKAAAELYEEIITTLCISYYERKERIQRLKETAQINEIDRKKPWNYYVDICIEKEKQARQEQKEEFTKEDELELRQYLDFFVSKENIEKIKREISLAAIQQQIEVFLKKDACQSMDMKTIIEATAVIMLLEIKAQDAIFKKKAQIEQQSGPQYMMMAKEDRVVQLTTSSRPYLYYLFEEDRLPEKVKIETVRIEAGIGRNQFEKVIIQLYSEREQKVLFEVSMNKGEYRHCNIIQGKIIKFLPTMSIGGNSWAYRRYYSSGDIRMGGKNQENEIILEYGKEVSCFSVGDSGALFIKDGKLIAQRYIPYQQNRYITDEIDALDYENFVEAVVMEQGYVFLSENGVTYSNVEGQNGKSGVISLSGTDGRKSLKGISNVREFCIDEREGNIGLHMLQRDEFKIYKESEKKVRRIDEKTWIIL